MNNENNSLSSKISEQIEAAFLKFSNENLLIVNRSADISFFDIFADSMFHYRQGIILVERFFKESKCKKKGMKHKEYSAKDKELLKNFKDFSDSIPEIKDLSDEEVNKINEKINNYKSEISTIEPKVSVLSTYQYKEHKLVEFNLLDEAYKKGLSVLYSEFGIAILSTMIWSPLTDIEIIIKTIEYDDYIDLVIFPVT